MNPRTLQGKTLAVAIEQGHQRSMRQRLLREMDEFMRLQRVRIGHRLRSQHMSQTEALQARRTNEVLALQQHNILQCSIHATGGKQLRLDQLDHSWQD